MKRVYGNVSKFEGIGLVAFIDILGFSNEIKKNWNHKTNNPLNKILKLKSDFPIINIEDKINPKIGGYKFQSRIQTISDSFIVSFGFDENMFKEFILWGTLSFLENVVYIWKKTLEFNYTVRGGITVGDIYWNENEIIGPALIDAYEIECNKAISSRILIDEKLYNKLVWQFNTHNSSWNDDLSNFFYRQKTNNDIIINPHCLYETTVERKLILKRLKQLRMNCESENNKMKYTPLINIISKNQTKFIFDSIDTISQ
jgi:hypothetical protein